MTGWFIRFRILQTILISILLSLVKTTTKSIEIFYGFRGCFVSIERFISTRNFSSIADGAQGDTANDWEREEQPDLLNNWFNKMELLHVLNF